MLTSRAGRLSRVAALLLVVLTVVATTTRAATAQGALQGLPHKSQPDVPQKTGAHARYSKAPINLNPPDLGLFVELVNAGGGSAFAAETFLGNVTGNGPLTQTERAVLVKKFGVDGLRSFDATFAFVVSDALTQINGSGMVLPVAPAAAPIDAKALATALVAAGTLPRGGFDGEYMLDAALSHIIHVGIMNDIDANATLGPVGDANFHLVLGQLLIDCKKAYGI